MLNFIMILLPPSLNETIYLKDPNVLALSEKAFIETDAAINPIQPWAVWKDIFEYIACVEHAKLSLNEIRSEEQLEARYHSGALVFYAQAVLDEIAKWLSDDYLVLGLNRFNKCFHKPTFKTALIDKINGFDNFYIKHETFINKLEEYRSEWIHRVIGGAQLYAEQDLTTGQPQNIQFMVPIDPSINTKNLDNYVQMVNDLIAEHGRWLYPLSEFIEYLSYNLQEIVLDSIKLIMDFEHAKV